MDKLGGAVSPFAAPTGIPGIHPVFDARPPAQILQPRASTGDPPSEPADTDWNGLGDLSERIFKRLIKQIKIMKQIVTLTNLFLTINYCNFIIIIFYFKIINK